MYVGIVNSAELVQAPTSYEETIRFILFSIPLKLTLISPEEWIPGDGWISGWISGYVSYAMRDGRPLLKVLGGWVLWRSTTVCHMDLKLTPNSKIAMEKPPC